MEERLEERIRLFLAVSYGSGSGSGSGSGYGYGYGDGYGSGSGYGYGYGSGSGSGYGSGSGSGSGSGYGYGYGYCYGYGDGDGYGYGYGDGSGSGYGYGYGYGDGSGITSFGGKKVYQIDGVATIIDKVFTVDIKKSPIREFAEGSILNSDFTLTPCYIVKVGNCFAHGGTLHDAYRDAAAKAMERMPIGERIAKFKEEFPDADAKIPARRLWEWHHTLTGSCAAGRNHFAKEHDINIDADSFTVCSFIHLTCNAYGGDVIRKLAEAYGIPLPKNK